MDVIFAYPEWLYLVLYSLPTFTWLVAALIMQIFTTKCLAIAYHLSKSNSVDPLRQKLRGRRIEFATYWIIGGIAMVYLIAFVVSVVNDNIGNVNRVLITVCYFIVMCVTVVSSVVFLCILKSKYGGKFLQERIKVSFLLLTTARRDD